MKNFLACLFFLLMISCGKKEADKEVFLEDNTKTAPYDTVAIDSFSTGAISVDIARKIKISSVAYQDSLKEVRKKMEAEKLLQKEKEESDKATIKVEENLNKTEALKAKKEKEKTISETSAPEKIIKP